MPSLLVQLKRWEHFVLYQVYFGLVAMHPLPCRNGAMFIMCCCDSLFFCSLSLYEYNRCATSRDKSRLRKRMNINFTLVVPHSRAFIGSNVLLQELLSAAPFPN